MSLPTFSSDFIDTTLYQLGASSIKVVSGKQHVVDFVLGDDLKVIYIFTITRENRFYLQRAYPYPMVHGRFSNEKEIIEFIAKDCRAFRNAMNSKNYQYFVDSARNALSLTEDLERLFMHRNVSHEDLVTLHDECGRLRQLIQEIYDKSPVVD